ncbi:MAG: SIR2 family protein [Planctomycetota bacterium]
MADLPFSVLPYDHFVRNVLGTLESFAGEPDAAFTLLLGSGFSYPLIPTASQMVLRDIPWWLFRRRSKELREKPFADAPSREPDLDEFAKRLWADVHRDASDRFELDEQGLPTPNGDNISHAYKAVMSGQSSRGLHTPALQRAYLRDACKRVGKRINMAHLYLASILSAQDRSDDRAAFCRTIFTTNFDPLLQRALQSVGQLYFMTDRPEKGIEPPDDQSDTAVHLIYTHGSIHRYFLANTPDDLDNLSHQNSAQLTQYFQRHGVIVMGYGGWPDTTMKALRNCDKFGNNLYWCDRKSPRAAAEGGLLHDVVDLLGQDRDNRYYVQLPESGADGAMLGLHNAMGLGVVPPMIHQPLDAVLSELRSMDLSGTRVEPPKPEGCSTRESTGLAESSPQEILDRTITRVEALRDQWTITSPSDSSDKKSLLAKVAQLENEAALAYYAGDLEKCIDLLSQLVEHPEASAEQRAKALSNRGVAKSKSVDTAGEIADYDRVLEMPDAPTEQRADALFNRGVAKGESGDTAGALADYDRVLEMPDVSVEHQAKALFNRGATKGKSGDTASALADYERVLVMPDAPAEQRAWALINRGAVKRKSGDTASALADYDRVLEMPDAPAEQQAQALVNRGFAKDESGDTAGALADYDRVLEMPDAPAEPRAAALVNRGNAKGKSGDTAGALADYDRVLEMPDAPAEPRAAALVCRGNAKGKSGDTAGEITDYSSVLEMPDAPTGYKANVYFNLGCALARSGNTAEAVAHLERWRGEAESPTRAKLDDDADFDPIREAPEFVAFREGLPG